MKPSLAVTQWPRMSKAVRDLSVCGKGDSFLYGSLYAKFTIENADYTIHCWDMTCNNVLQEKILHTWMVLGLSRHKPCQNSDSFKGSFTFHSFTKYLQTTAWLKTSEDFIICFVLSWGASVWQQIFATNSNLVPFVFFWEKNKTKSRFIHSGLLWMKTIRHHRWSTGLNRSTLHNPSIS